MQLGHQVLTLCDAAWPATLRQTAMAQQFRSLTAAELEFTWQPRSARLSAPSAELLTCQQSHLAKLRLGSRLSPLHPQRFGGNCEATRAFGSTFDAPCLSDPRQADWLALLRRGTSLLLVGDSVLG